MPFSRPARRTGIRVSRAAVLILVLAAVVGQSSIHATSPAPLSFFKNYFLTGDYTVGGTSLWRRGVNGVASGSIRIADVPESAEVVAAFLYVQTVEKVQW